MIYAADHAERLKEDAGKPWRPSNGTEADFWQELVCVKCQVVRFNADGTLFCPIWDAAFWNDIGDPEYPAELVIGPDGQPKCNGYKPKEQGE